MQWENLNDFLNMRGYAWYVWGSYGVTFGFMLIELILLMSKKKTMMQRLARIARMNREQ